jgi:hypothetical protein
VVHQWRPCSPSCRLSNRRQPPTAPRCALYASSSRQSYHSTRAVSHVGVGLGIPRAPCWTTPGQATPCSVGSLHGAHCRHLAAGEPAGTASSRMLYAIPGEERCAREGVTPHRPASLAVGHIILACSAVWPGRGWPSMLCACGSRSNFGPEFIFFFFLF